MQHVATWKEGDEKWAYHKDAFAHIGTHKVSLDPYRLESRRILACIKGVLPVAPIQRVEKASVDEVFLDLSAQIHSLLLERYSEISGPPPYDDPTEFLPRPPTTALDWNTDALVDLDHSETEDDDPDWDDITILLGSEIVRSVRAAIREQLKYTCSAGIARNKMIAKLGSAHKKPNQQTIVRNRAVQHFMGGFKFTKIRNLGGKLGDDIVSRFGTDEIKELLLVPIEQLKSKMGDETGSWVYHIIRGEDSSDVNSRTQIKSMLSAKSFRPTINSSEQAVRWLRIFIADIMSRLVEEGVLENKRRPRTLNLHHRQGAQMRTRSAPIPTGRAIDEALLFDIAKTLLSQIVVDGRAWPCSNLQLSVSGFEDGPTGNRGISGFLVKGEEAKATVSSSYDTDRDASSTDNDHTKKRRKINDGVMHTFLSKGEVSREDFGDFSDTADNSMVADDAELLPPVNPITRNVGEEVNAEITVELSGSTLGESVTRPAARAQRPLMQQATLETFFCDRCGKDIPIPATSEHGDWHIASDLQFQEETNPLLGRRPMVGAKTRQGPKASNAPTQKGIEKGQSRLAFGSK